MKVHISLEQAHAGALMLVNDRRPLSVWPTADKLESVGRDADGKAILLRRDAANALRALLGAIRAGGAIVPVSGWRAHAEQEALYADCLRDNGKDFTEKYVALPGCAEHETGLAIDVGENRPDIDFIRPAFPDVGICAVFRRAAASFGFIERYPENARAVTHIGGEPWHFRYIGTPHAQWLKAAGVTLEEYIEKLCAFTEEKPLRALANGRGYIVFRVPLGENGADIHVNMPEGAQIDVSADGCGGVIVTAALVEADSVRSLIKDGTKGADAPAACETTYARTEGGAL